MMVTFCTPFSMAMLLIVFVGFIMCSEMFK